MKNIQSKAILIGGYLRVIAIALAIAATLIFGAKAFCIAPHVPDMGLRPEIDMYREGVEKYKDQKASDKVQKYSKHKIKDRGHKDKIKEKAMGKKKHKEKKQKTPKQKKIKIKKPPKPTKEEKKRAKRHRARNSV